MASVNVVPMVGRMWNGTRVWLERRPAVLPLLLLGSLLIALAAGPAPTEGSWTGLPDADVFRWGLGIVVGILALTGLLLILSTRNVATRAETKRRSWVATLAASLFLIALFSVIDFEGELAEPVEEEEPPAIGPGPTGPEVEPGPGFEAGDATALILILVVAVILLVWTRRSIVTPEVATPEPSSPLDDSLSRAEGHLLDGSDPREAVLLAYRDLEMTLASLELPRRDSETPTEHLDRALAALSITDREQAEPLRDLASLYARARYSDHRITEDEQHRAGSSLGRARRRLVEAD